METDLQAPKVPEFDKLGRYRTRNPLQWHTWSHHCTTNFSFVPTRRLAYGLVTAMFRSQFPLQNPIGSRQIPEALATITVANTRNHHASHERLETSMKKKTDSTDLSLNEIMVARIEIEELGNPVRQKEITDAVATLDGVIETKIENGALHVSYDPLATTEKKIEKAIRSIGTTIKTAATDTEGPHPDLPT